MNYLNLNLINFLFIFFKKKKTSFFTFASRIITFFTHILKYLSSELCLCLRAFWQCFRANTFFDYSVSAQTFLLKDTKLFGKSIIHVLNPQLSERFKSSTSLCYCVAGVPRMGSENHSLRKLSELALG